MNFLSQIVQLTQTDFTKLLSNIGSSETINGHNIKYDQNTLYLFDKYIPEWSKGANRSIRSNKSFYSNYSKYSGYIEALDFWHHGGPGFTPGDTNCYLPFLYHTFHSNGLVNFYKIKFSEDFYYNPNESTLYGSKFSGTFEGHYIGNLWISNNTTSNASCPLLWSDSTSSGYANIKQSYSKLYYNPSTSMLTNAGTVLSSGTPGFANDVAASKWAYSRFKSGTYEWHVGTNSSNTSSSGTFIQQEGAFEIRSFGSSYSGISIRYNTSSFGKLVVTATAGSTGEVSIGLRRGTSGNPQWVFGIISTNDRFGFYNTAQGKWKANFSPNGNLYLGDGDTAASYKLHVMGDALLKEGKIYIFDTGNFVASDGNNQSIYLSTNNKIVSLNSNDNAFRRGTASTSANLTLGTASYRWANIYSVLGNFSGQITSSVATGTSPFAITSTTLNTNLNADLLDGRHQYEFMPLLHYGENSATRWYKVRINTGYGSMFSITIKVNGGYVHKIFEISGYNYATKKGWYSPSATCITDSEYHSSGLSNTVVFGKDGDGEIWFAVYAYGYNSIEIIDSNFYWSGQPTDRRNAFTFSLIDPANVDENFNGIGTVVTTSVVAVVKATKLSMARTLTIGATGQTFDGSANVSWTLANIFGTTAIGSTTQPIYWNGSNFATTYKLSAEVESGVTNKMARYSSNTKISPASRIWATDNSLFINMDGVITDTTYKFAVAGGSSVIETTVPKMHNTYFLGSTDRRWKESYNVEEYVGTASGSQCHLKYDTTDDSFNFIFD